MRVEHFEILVEERSMEVFLRVNAIRNRSHSFRVFRDAVLESL